MTEDRVNGDRTSEPLPGLVSTDWLAARLGRSRLRVVDGSWYLPSAGRDPAQEYAGGHIPGAVFFDLDAFPSSLPHMLPPPPPFAERMGRLGLHDADDLVVYDGSGANLSAARVWWTFRVLGHERVAVLDGGIGKWRSENRPLERGTPAPPPGRFSARLDRSAVRDLAAIRFNLARRSEQVVDLRSAGRFAGTEPEPRPGLRGGHIPGSLSLPFHELARADGTMLPEDELRRRIERAGVDLARPVIATCGSGTSACALVLALHLLGHDSASVFDGAWAEWGGQDDTPVETGGPG